MRVKSWITDEHVTKGNIYEVFSDCLDFVIVKDDSGELWDLFPEEFEILWESDNETN